MMDNVCVCVRMVDYFLSMTTKETTETDCSPPKAIATISSHCIDIAGESQQNPRFSTHLRNLLQTRCRSSGLLLCKEIARFEDLESFEWQTQHGKGCN